MKRKVVLFIVKQLVLFGVFYLTLNYLVFDLIDSNGQDKTIEIRSSDRDSDKLQLYPSGTEEVYAGKQVIWKNRDTDNDVRSFHIKPKDGQPDVFKDGLPTGNENRPAVGHLKSRANSLEYEYSILWVDRDGNPHPYDPKIAIRPGTSIFDILISILYALLVAMISFMTFKK